MSDFSAFENRIRDLEYDITKAGELARADNDQLSREIDGLRSQLAHVSASLDKVIIDIECFRQWQARIVDAFQDDTDILPPPEV